MTDQLVVGTLLGVGLISAMLLLIAWLRYGGGGVYP